MNQPSQYNPNSFIMKHFLPLLFALLTTPLWSQTGNGVVLLTDASHTFTPTTVDSTTSFSFQLVNEVGVAQTVFFGALDAPFSMDDNSPVEIPSPGHHRRHHPLHPHRPRLLPRHDLLRGRRLRQRRTRPRRRRHPGGLDVDAGHLEFRHHRDRPDQQSNHRILEHR